MTLILNIILHIQSFHPGKTTKVLFILPAALEVSKLVKQTKAKKIFFKDREEPQNNPKVNLDLDQEVFLHYLQSYSYFHNKICIICHVLFYR